MHCHSLFKLSHETQYYGETERHWNLYYLLAGTNARFSLSQKDRRNSSTFNNITSMTVNSVQSKRSCVRVHFERANENKKPATTTTERKKNQ